METCVDIQAAERERSRRLTAGRASVAVALRHENMNYSGRVTSDAPGHGTSVLSCHFAAHFVHPEPQCRTASGRTKLTLGAQAID